MRFRIGGYLIDLGLRLIELGAKLRPFEPIAYPGRPVADRGDDLDWEWEDVHGDNPL